MGIVYLKLKVSEAENSCKKGKIIIEKIKIIKHTF